MEAFDGIDPIQQQAIRRALEKEIRTTVSAELNADIRARIEQDVRAETRQRVLQEVAERAPTREERERFIAYVREVRVDAQTQADLSSARAATADAQRSRSSRVAEPILAAGVVGGPLIVHALAGWAALAGPALWVVITTLVLAYLALLVTSARRNHRLSNTVGEQAKLSSDFMIIAERARAFEMVHAERLTSSRELHDVLEELRRAKERQDQRHRPDTAALEKARSQARLRIDADTPSRIAATTDESSDEEDVELRRRLA